MRSIQQQDHEKRVAWMVNEERRLAGLPRLEVAPLLGVAARAHSADMAARNFYSHDTPEGLTVAHRVMAAGYVFALVGENIAWGQETARQVMNAWMRSRGHKANILHPDYTEIGVGVVATRRGAVVWTQNFGIPAA